MSFLNSRFIDSDNELSTFTSALALPARVTIIRFITANGNTITPEDFSRIALTPEIVNAHVLELKSLGILNVEKRNNSLTYSIDQSLFNQMANQYATLIDSINSLRASL
ncbi:MAG: transcriptional regulator [Mucilaginibacter sp.]|nr:transcriptional regulator [Mucilaginibacter sp.]